MYIMIAATLFRNYEKKKRLSYVKKYYNVISQQLLIFQRLLGFSVSPLRQFSSCAVDSDDTLPSIFNI